MGVSITQDVEFNRPLKGYFIDMSGWDYVVVQIINNSNSIVFKSTNDGGAIEGSLQDAAITADNFSDILGINVSDGTTSTSTSGNGMFKFNDFARYIKLYLSDEPSQTIKVKAMLYKIG